MFESQFLSWLTALDHPILNLISKCLSLISHENFYFILIPLIYWCIHKEIGFLLLYLLVGSMYINNFLKDLIKIERPPQASVEGYSFPSGHTQAATAFWGMLITIVSKHWFTFISIILILLIGLNRLYVGAHWPIDLVGAIAIGIFLIYLANRSLDWIGSMPEGILLLIIIGLPLALFLLSPGNANSAGMLLGAGFGYYLEKIKNRMEISPYKMKKVLAFIIGFMGIIAIQSIQEFLPDHVLIEFFVAIGLGLWVTYIAPMLFVSLSIYKRKGFSLFY